MSRANAAQEIVAYLAGPAPEDAAADLRDLGVIGFANELSGISPETMRTLIAGALQRGRSWDDIGRRLDMTAGEAERAYRRLSPPPQQDQPTGLRYAIAKVLDGLVAIADAVSETLDRASHGVERSHRR